MEGTNEDRKLRKKIKDISAEENVFVSQLFKI